MARTQELTGKQKAAILLVSLGTEVSANIMKSLREDEIEELTMEIANLKRVPTEVKDQVVEEFLQICIAQEYIVTGGIDYARDILEKALGAQRAKEIISKLTATLQIRPFDFARKTEPS